MSEVNETNNRILADALMLGQNAAAAGIRVFLPTINTLDGDDAGIRFEGKDGKQFVQSKVTIDIKVKHLSTISSLLRVLCVQNHIEVKQLEANEE